jgi:hypothetical protein
MTGEMRKSGAAAGALAKHGLFKAWNFFPFQPLERKGSLSYEESCDGKSKGYLGRVCAWIETGTSTTFARVFFRMPFPLGSGTTGVAHEHR